MSESNPSPHRRRASDLTEDGLVPTITDVWRLLNEIHDRMCEVEKITTAFVKDDLERPDFDGHRKAHLAWIRDHEKMDTYKLEATKKVIGLAVVFFVGLMTSGWWSTLQGHIK